eukprot:ANDGO_07002.mRNA.1 hypothetical protein
MESDHNISAKIRRQYFMHFSLDDPLRGLPVQFEDLPVVPDSEAGVPALKDLEGLEEPITLAEQRLPGLSPPTLEEFRDLKLESEATDVDDDELLNVGSAELEDSS